MPVPEISRQRKEASLHQSDARSHQVPVFVPKTALAFKCARAYPDPQGAQCTNLFSSISHSRILSADVPRLTG
jgi:hypothetical protein